MEQPSQTPTIIQGTENAANAVPTVGEAAAAAIAAKPPLTKKRKANANEFQRLSTIETIGAQTATAAGNGGPSSQSQPMKDLFLVLTDFISTVLNILIFWSYIATYHVVRHATNASVFEHYPFGVINDSI